MTWMVYWRCQDAPKTAHEKSPDLAVLAGTDIEAVWRWDTMPRNGDGVDMLKAWGTSGSASAYPASKKRLSLSIGPLQGNSSKPEDNYGTSTPRRTPSPPVGTMREIYGHRPVYRRIDQRHSEFEGYEPGIAIASTAELSQGDFRFMVDINENP